MTSTISVEEAWNELLEDGVSEQTLRVVTDINGRTIETMRDIEYSMFGTRDLGFSMDDEDEGYDDEGNDYEG